MRAVLLALTACAVAACTDEVALSPQCDVVADAWCDYLVTCGAIPSDRGTPDDSTDDIDDVPGCRAALFGSCVDQSADETVCLSEIEAVSRINLDCGTTIPSPPSACDPWL